MKQLRSQNTGICNVKTVLVHALVFLVYKLFLLVHALATSKLTS